MSGQMWVSIIILVVILGIAATPAYQSYRYWLQNRLGYWNTLVPIGIALLANLIACLISGKIMVLFLLPLDFIFVFDAVITCFQIRRIKK